MEFFHQVKLLLWKNYLLRKRSRVFTIVELLWPLMLFLILTWVRTKELKKEWPECEHYDVVISHFEPKSMPSTGLFEFFRSAICSFNNTCHRDEFVQRSFREELIRQEAEDNFSADQKFTQVLNDFEKVQNFLMHSIDPTFLERTLRLMNYTAQVNDSAQIPDLSVLMESSWDAWLFGFPKGYEKLMNFLKKAIVPGGASENDLRWYTNSAIEVLRGLRGLQVSEPTKNLLSRLRAVDFNDPAKGDTVTQVFPGLGNETWKLIDIFWPLGCGAEFNYAGQAIQRAQKNSFDEIVNRWQFEVEENYTSDPDFSPFCNRLFHKMQSTKGVTFFWKQMKPFIAGKLLYTPSVDWTDRIMTRVNSFWGGLKEFFNLVKFLRDVLPLLDAKSLSESSFFATLRSEQGRRNFRTLIGGFSAGDNVVEGLKRLLDWVDSPEASEAHARVSSGLETFLDYSECFRFDKIQPVENEAELVALGQNLTADNKLWAGLVFYPDVDADNATNATEDNLDLASCVIPSKADHLLGNSLSKNSLGYQNNESRCADNSTMPKFVVYKIRMDGGKVDDVSGLRDRIKNQGPRFRPALDLKFITFGFAYLQDLVEQAIVQEQTLNVGGVIGDWTPPPLPGLTMQQFPYPCYIEDRFIIAIERTFPMFMVLSWVFSAAMVIRSVVYEKELRLKETMRVMGLSRGTHWVAWTISSLCVMSVSAVLLAGLLVIGRTLDNTSFAVVLLFLFSYSVATLMLSFLLSCFFSRANLAAAAGGILFFVTYLPYPFMIVWDHSVLDWQRFIGSALSNVAFGFGCDVLAEWEELGVGAHWHNLFQSPDPFNTELSLGSQILALWVDAMLYFLAAVYIEGVFPGRYGVPLPWWYPFSLSYWSGDFVGKDNKFDAEPASPGNRKVNESDPVGLTKGVEMINLRKVYDDYDKIAVDNLNLSFYENQITAFLGHNGAGKTTTISILTGLLQPTAGTAKIYGQDIRTEMDSIRKSMGVCPQHNVLFHYMTVEEHLLFYAGLKGTLSDQEMDREVQDMIRDLGLPKKRHELSCNLSGGMQRKLSIAISFLAKSRLVCHSL
ncbi:unnamed protein product [Notodromas monacha]|uniref:ABC transporter domain-containing protein n=1 Tax=Notodromas monacha TaxID=399045 RepID=A0A7R9BIH7_9CRUS|nr:unnamed protein product [Notodromas monacha]CAG0915033.1 unnamed protein product [Notodromas monacha]